MTRWSCAAAAAAMLLAGCGERPPMESVQRGYRGLGMEQIFNPRIVQARIAEAPVPAPTPPAEPGGPPATTVFKNVQVLQDLSVNEFTRLMVAITAWVSPEQGCTYCHAPGEDLSADTLYTKVVARRMLQMNRRVNQDWKQHVGDTGVTCYTCHRGKPVPGEIWFSDPDSLMAAKFIGNKFGQNTPAPSVALSTLPADPFTPFMSSHPGEVRVVSKTALPAGPGASIQHTEWTYALMTHMSVALGVNCTYCHNSRSFAEWDASTPQRATAWYGLRMVRDLNANYLEPLTKSFPAARLGPNGDVAKVGCGTCHGGLYKPLLGAQMAKDYPELNRVKPAPTGPGSAGAAAAGPTAAPASVLGRILFDTDRTELTAEARATIASIVAAMQRSPTLKVDVSGFADQRGSAGHNLELAKQRAFAVRDALKAAGIAEDRVVLRKPEFAIGADASGTSRRVDVVAAM